MARTSKYPLRFDVWLSQDLINKIHRIAILQGMTASKLVRGWIISEIERAENPKAGVR